MIWASPFERTESLACCGWLLSIFFTLSRRTTGGDTCLVSPTVTFRSFNQAKGFGRALAITYTADTLNVEID
jgi:hypothetical protein